MSAEDLFYLHGQRVEFLQDDDVFKILFLFLNRHELLSIVRKHSSFLKNGATTSNKNKESEDELDMRFWREMVDMFFVRGMTSLKAPQDDDLVFFVRHMVCLDPFYLLFQHNQTLFAE